MQLIFYVKINSIILPDPPPPLQQTVIGIKWKIYTPARLV